MKIKNRELSEAVRNANLHWLEEDIRACPEEEVYGTDIDFVLEEIDYYIDMHNPKENTPWSEDLKQAKELLKKTDNGKMIPVDPSKGFQPKNGYRPQDIEKAKEIVDEFKRLKELRRKVSKIGK